MKFGLAKKCSLRQDTISAPTYGRLIFYGRVPGQAIVRQCKRRTDTRYRSFIKACESL
jgi:hypothetical protein